MRRRRFLQLAAISAAGAMVHHVSAASTSQSSLRIAAPVTKYGESLGVSGWVDADDVIHLMMEKRHPASFPEIEFSKLEPGRRYQMRLMNGTDSDVSMQLPARRVKLTRMEQAPVRASYTDSILLKHYSVVEAAFVLE